jgi:5-methylcytosine-specific restriction protein A
MLNTKRVRDLSMVTHRTRGRRLMELRALILAEEPLCRPCQAKGKVSAAIEIDHILALHLGGADERENCQPICITCHKEKTMREFSKRVQPHESWGD